MKLNFYEMNYCELVISSLTLFWFKTTILTGRARW